MSYTQASLVLPILIFVYAYVCIMYLILHNVVIYVGSHIYLHLHSKYLKIDFLYKCGCTHPPFTYIHMHTHSNTCMNTHTHTPLMVELSAVSLYLVPSVIDNVAGGYDLSDVTIMKGKA